MSDKTTAGHKKRWTIEALCNPCTGNGKGYTGAPHNGGWKVVSRYATEKARDTAFRKTVFDKAAWPTRKGNMHHDPSPNTTAVLTEAQSRLLCFMDEHGPKWFTLLELDSIKLLEPDDVLTIPSLIGRGLVMHLAAIQAVALTASGTVIADEIRSANWSNEHDR